MRLAMLVSAGTVMLLAACSGETADSPPQLPESATAGEANSPAEAADPQTTTASGATDTTREPDPEATTTGETTATTQAADLEATTGEEEPQVVASHFDVPWGLALLGDGRLLVGERDTAQVYAVTPGQAPQLVTTVPGVEAGGEGGLLGVAVPEDNSGESFYAYATTPEDNRVLEVDPTASAEDGAPVTRVVIDGIPKAGNHNGGRIAFGPDGYLYVTTGDATDGESAQDPQSLAGKILRITAEGQPAPGNPDPDSPVWSLGHRNVQGLGWDDEGRLWASEFGSGDFDELNLIEPGGNYGWPQVEGLGGAPEFIDPVVVWPTSEASPSGLAVTDDAIYMAALRGQSLWRIPLQDSGAGEPERLLDGVYGRLRSVVAGADGQLWVLTSNTFRGDPAEDDDRLLLVNDPSTLQAG